MNITKLDQLKSRLAELTEAELTNKIQNQIIFNVLLPNQISMMFKTVNNLIATRRRSDATVALLEIQKLNELIEKLRF